MIYIENRNFFYCGLLFLNDLKKDPPKWDYKNII